MDAIEFQWQEKCNRSAMMKLVCEKETIADSYTHDFNAMYPYLLGSRSTNYGAMPTKRGKEQILKEVPTKDVEIGYYRANIISNDKCFNTLFNFSKERVYTHCDIMFIMSCQKRGIKIQVELLQDGEPNAYLYGTFKASNEIYPSHKIFRKWYEVLNFLKTN